MDTLRFQVIVTVSLVSDKQSNALHKHQALLSNFE